MDLLVLAFEAPLMSFGGVVVDQNNPTEQFPYRSMLVGLLANALGWTRRQERELARLQERLVYGARRDRKGHAHLDYQTVDLGEDGPLASNLGWTTHGRLEERKGGGASDGTHIRFRHYLADARFTVLVGLEPATEAPTLDVIEAALRAPARPLFLGRKCCIPSRPILVRRTSAAGVLEGLGAVPRERGSDGGELAALWSSAEPGEPSSSQLVMRTEDRDWTNSIHVGRRAVWEGLVEPPEANP